jgi:hypothetical protein
MLANAFGGLIAAGIIARMEGKLGRPAWVSCFPELRTVANFVEEWLFIIEGSITIGIALLVMPILPDYPLQRASRFISQEQQLFAEWRIRKENAGIRDEDSESILWGLKQALVDPKLYMFIALQMTLLTAQSFNNFFPSIVGTLGYNTTITLLLTAPPYVLAFIASISISFHAAHTHERGWHIAIPLMFAVLGNLMVRLGLPSYFQCLIRAFRPCSYLLSVDVTSQCSSCARGHTLHTTFAFPGSAHHFPAQHRSVPRPLPLLM